MSASLLRDAAIADIAAEITKMTDLLAIRTQDGLDQVRLRQGTIAGLQRATELLTLRANNLHAKADHQWR